MSDRTDRLRDVFLDAAGSETVTESQRAGRGTLDDVPDTLERVSTLVDEFRDHHALESDLSNEVYAAVILGVYDGQSDEAIAADLGLDASRVQSVRFDLHLVRDADLEIEHRDALLDCLADDGPETCADRLDLDSTAVARFVAAVKAHRRSLEAGHVMRDRIEHVLADTDLSLTRTAGITDDGLVEAAEDIETDVAF